MYGKVRWISTASGSERASRKAALVTARGTDPYTHISTPYIDLQSDLVLKPVHKSDSSKGVHYARS